MNLSISDEFNLFSKELQHCLSPLALQEVAREVGFVKRTSKYRAQATLICVASSSSDLALYEVRVPQT